MQAPPQESRTVREKGTGPTVVISLRRPRGFRSAMDAVADVRGIETPSDLLDTMSFEQILAEAEGILSERRARMAAEVVE